MNRSAEDRIPPPRTPAAYHVLPKSYFYGWNIALACSVLMFVTVGVGYYGLAVFLRPLQEEHGWSNTVVSAATSLYFVVSGIAAALIGPHVDRRGPIVFIITGTILIGISVAAIGFIDSTWQLFATYTLLALGYGMASSVTVNSILTRWFMHRRALAMSISATGISIGGMVLTPLGSWLIDVGGLTLAAPILGAAVALVPLPVVALVLLFDPRQMGLQPDGRQDGDPEPPAGRYRMTTESQMRVWTIPEAMRTVSFWSILVGFVLIMLAQTGFVIHQIAFLEDRFESRSTAALTLSMTAFGSIFARLVMGLFADRMDKRLLTVALFAMQATSVLLLLAVESTWATFALTLVFGFTLGNIFMLQSLLVGEIFGMMSFGAIFGMILLASQSGSGVGPLLIGWLEQQTGDYTASLMTTAALTYVAAVVVLFARPVPAPGATPAEVESATSRPR